MSVLHPLFVAPLALAVALASCAHTPAGGPPASSAADVMDNVAVPTPELNGTCTITDESGVESYTYVDGRLVESTATMDEFRTVYTYEGERLVRVERTIRGELAFIRALTYDEDGRLSVMSTSEPAYDPPTPVESERRVYAYDDAGRLARVTRETAEGEATDVCVFHYDERGRAATHTCRALNLPDEEPSVFTYEYGPGDRVAAVRADYLTFRYGYAVSGLRESLEALSPEGDVVATETLVRDAEGRVVERRMDARGEVSVDVMAYEGRFGAGAVCETPALVPPGFPDVPQASWLEMSP